MSGPERDTDAPLPSSTGTSTGARRSQFLERETYRRARLEDAARLLPILGLLMFISPIAIQSAHIGARGHTVGWLVFFMVVWLGLIGLAALMSRALRRRGQG